MEDDRTPPARKRSFEEVVANFVASLEGRVGALEEALGRQCWEEVQMLSHRLAGAALFGFPEIGQVAHALEGAAREHHVDQVPQLFEQLKERCLAVANR